MYSPETLCCVAHLIKSVRIVQKVLHNYVWMPFYARRGQGQGQVTYLRSRYDNESAWHHLNLNISKNWTDFFNSARANSALFETGTDNLARLQRAV